MAWADIAFDWNQVRAFLVTAEEGSLSAAARALGLTQPTLGRQVAALEAQLGVTLFERTGRALILTRAGTDLLSHVRDMGEAARRVSLAASGQSQAVAGLVRITASQVMSAYILPAVISRLREIAPQVEIEVVAEDATQDLMRREADIAIRHARSTQADLIAKLVRTDTAYLYAARSYLDLRGRPAAPADLATHDFVGFGDNDRMITFLASLGLPVTHANFRAGSASGLVAWEMVRRGLGIGPMADEIAAMTPDVERILPELEPIPVPVWLAVHRELRTSRRIRVVYDLLAEMLQAPTARSSLG